MKNKFRGKVKRFKKNFIRDWQLYLLILVPLIYILIFSYGPMYGVQIAFRDYRPRAGITGSEWVGFQWFEKFLTSVQFKEVFLNTLILSVYSIVVGFPIPIIFALILNALRRKKFKKMVETVSYMPHFISLTVMVAIMNMVLSPTAGIYGAIYRMLGGEGYPTDFRVMEESFRHLYVFSGVWQNLGWNTIIYTSALSAVSTEQHEAAKIDGASRLKRIWHIDLPAIMPTIMIMFIMRCGNIISVGYEKAYLMQTNMNLNVSEIISTYVYKYGMNSFRNFSYGSAVGLFNTVINLALLCIVNYISNRATDKEVSLF